MNYVWYGEETYLIRKQLAVVLKEHNMSKDDFSYIELDGLACTSNQLIEELHTMPFLNDKKIVVLNHANFMKAQNDSSIDPEAVALYLENSELNTTLVMIVDGASIDARKKIVKLAHKVCKVQGFSRLDTLGKQSFILSEIKKRSIEVKKDALEIFMDRLSFDMQSMMSEFDKIECYPGVIDKKIAQQLISQRLEDDVFKLQNALLKNNIKEAMHLWQDFQVLNKDAIYLIALLASSYRFSYQVKHLMDLGKPKDYIASELKAHPYRVLMSMQALNHIEKDALIRVLTKLATLDQEIKSGTIDKNIGFELFLIQQNRSLI